MQFECLYDCIQLLNVIILYKVELIWVPGHRDNEKTDKCATIGSCLDSIACKDVWLTKFMTMTSVKY